MLLSAFESTEPDGLITESVHNLRHEWIGKSDHP